MNEAGLALLPAQIFTFRHVCPSVGRMTPKAVTEALAAQKWDEFVFVLWLENVTPTEVEGEG